jgi:hypothetical protein
MAGLGVEGHGGPGRSLVWRGVEQQAWDGLVSLSKARRGMASTGNTRNRRQGRE